MVTDAKKTDAAFYRLFSEDIMPLSERQEMLEKNAACSMRC
jgi:hypothetical protein